MAQVALLLALILAAILALFGAQNTETVALHFLWFTAHSLPLWLAILGGAIVGALLSFLVALPSRFRHALSEGGLTQQNARQKKQIAQFYASAAHDKTTTESALPHS